MAYTVNQIQQLFQEHNFQLLDDVYINNDQKLKVLCHCNNVWYTSLNNFTKLVNKNCPNCRPKTRYTLQQVKDEFRKRGYILISNTYNNDKEKLEAECICGRKFYVSFYDMKKGYKCRSCWLEAHSGENNTNYNPDLTKEDRERQRPKEVKEWSKAIMARDRYTCHCCNKKGGELNAHHLYNYSDNEELRTDLRNGRTLCRSCHLDFHSKYGYRNTTYSDYYFWFFPENSCLFDFADDFSMKRQATSKANVSTTVLYNLLKETKPCLN